ncbi:hypothetical protein HRbin23_00938 [bacterium HR23]|nr:hypothetical protein HRbin23_00938 [bacterium HR23]
MATANGHGLQSLRQEVLEAGLCTYCGACSGLCPYLRPFQGRIAVLDPCPVVQGRCYSFCPRTGLDMDALTQALHGTGYDGSPLGPVRRVLMARSRDPEVLAHAQYGGVVTTLVCLALDEGLVQGAVLTRSQGGIPQGVVATRREEVLQCAGSHYLASPTLEALNRLSPRTVPVAVVGTPCQMLALAKMRLSPLAQRSNIGKVSLTIGLFCTWALSHKFLEMLSTVASPERVRKTDVPPPPARVFEVHTEAGVVALPLDAVRAYIPPACTLCADMTAEMADLSVGSAEGVPGWNTVLVRTPRGETLVERAVARGLLAVDALPQANLEHLTESAQVKKRRALQNLAQRSGRPTDFLYLRLSREVAGRLLGTP